jgi:uncharacterized protein
MDADAIVIGAAGILVVRRSVPGRHAGAAPDGIRDSRELAWQDWLGSAFFDRGADDPAGEDDWAYRWAQAYVDFAAGEKRSWLHALGVRWFPLVGWAERGGYLADGHGNSVPRFHVTWGTGPAVVAPFERQVREAAAAGLASPGSC